MTDVRHYVRLLVIVPYIIKLLECVGPLTLVYTRNVPSSNLSGCIEMSLEIMRAVGQFDERPSLELSRLRIRRYGVHGGTSGRIGEEVSAVGFTRWFYSECVERLIEQEARATGSHDFLVPRPLVCAR